MRRILTRYLDCYSRYFICRMYTYQFLPLRDENSIQKLKIRRGFLKTSDINDAFRSPGRFHDYVISNFISPLNKFLLFSGLKAFSSSASLKTIKYLGSSASYTDDLPIEYNIGCATLSRMEILLLFNVIFKKYYTVKHLCDLRRYLTHLNTYVSWQSLTTPLSRFPTKDRKLILDTVGKIINSYTETNHSSNLADKISIW